MSSYAPDVHWNQYQAASGMWEVVSPKTLKIVVSIHILARQIFAQIQLVYWEFLNPVSLNTEDRILKH